MKNIYFALAAVLLFTAACSSSSSGSLYQGNAPTSPSPTAGISGPVSPSSNAPLAGLTSATASQKFTDQPYYGNSYLISGDTLSAEAQTALTGFTLSKKTLADGTTQINLTAQKAGYKDQQYILKPGEQLYFIEKFLADDQGGQENNTGDDQAVVVDAQGNVVGAPAAWTK